MSTPSPLPTVLVSLDDLKRLIVSEEFETLYKLFSEEDKIIADNLNYFKTQTEFNKKFSEFVLKKLCPSSLTAPGAPSIPTTLLSYSIVIQNLDLFKKIIEVTSVPVSPTTQRSAILDQAIKTETEFPLLFHIAYSQATEIFKHLVSLERGFIAQRWTQPEQNANKQTILMFLAFLGDKPALELLHYIRSLPSLRYYLRDLIQATDGDGRNIHSFATTTTGTEKEAILKFIKDVHTELGSSTTPYSMGGMGMYIGAPYYGPHYYGPHGPQPYTSVLSPTARTTSYSYGETTATASAVPAPPPFPMPIYLTSPVTTFAREQATAAEIALDGFLTEKHKSLEKLRLQSAEKAKLITLLEQEYDKLLQQLQTFVAPSDYIVTTKSSSSSVSSAVSPTALLFSAASGGISPPITLSPPRTEQVSPSRDSTTSEDEEDENSPSPT